MQFPTYLKEKILQLEASTDGNVIVLAATMLDIDMLPALESQLLTLSFDKPLYVVLYGKGGSVVAAKRIGLLIKNLFSDVHFIAPRNCESACTLLLMCADSVYTSNLSIFTPFDPRINTAGNDENAPGAIVAEDIRLFKKMAADWFNINSEGYEVELLKLLLESIYPTSLTALYRSTKDIEKIAGDLNELSKTPMAKEVLEKTVEQLIYGFGSHSYAISQCELRKMHFNVKDNDNVEELSKSIVAEILNYLGGNARAKIEDPRIDTIILTTKAGVLRQHNFKAISPTWAECSYAV